MVILIGIIYLNNRDIDSFDVHIIKYRRSILRIYIFRADEIKLILISLFKFLTSTPF
jgi:hypothetical protein